MKKVLFSMVMVLCSALCFAAPNEKVLKNFTHSFPAADSVKWYESDNGYEVHFKTANMQCRLWYDADGQVIKSYRYYLQDKLPPMIRASIQRQHSDKTIFGVTEITNSEGIKYYIVLEDDKKWYDVTSDSVGNLTLTKKMNKAEQ